MGASDLPELAEFREFFAPASTDMVDGLIGEYKQARGWIEEVAQFAEGPICKAVLGHFLSGNATEERGRISMELSASQLFQREGAIANLNATYWSKALELTDVYNAMPQKRRDEWNAMIRNPAGKRKDYHEVKRERSQYPYLFDAKGEYVNPALAWDVDPLPEFEEETVRSTLTGLLGSRATFLAERVDGIFRALSGEHVTNSPMGFGKRMIIAYLINSYGSSDHDRVGYINDLRCVIAKFMGRDEPAWHASSSVVEYARRDRRGEWVTLDGGALRLRAYKCGTAHLEVHPDMAWRLNCVLAHLHPNAIPSEFRSQPKRKAQKTFKMMGRPLPFVVLASLEALEPAVLFVKNEGPGAWRDKFKRVSVPNAVEFRDGGKCNTPEREEAARVLAYIGGVRVPNDRNGERFEFDYHPREVIKEIIASGCLPDQKTHQFYPTPNDLARLAFELAEIGPDHACLEPSAGTGSISDLMPKDQTYCVEISSLHCEILRSKGAIAQQADFLTWGAGRVFDRIVMNPPFSEGRWQAHLSHAASMLSADGRLVAVLPASAKGKELLPGFSHEWHGPYDNQFAGTSVSVVILVAEPSA